MRPLQLLTIACTLVSAWGVGGVAANKARRLRATALRHKSGSNSECRFDVFRDGQVHPETTNGTNVDWQSGGGGALVVQDGDSRILVFRREGEDGAAPHCHEQAEIKCGAAADSDALIQQFQQAVSPAACANMPKCEPDTTPNLSYIKSMIGGAIDRRGGPKRVQRVVSVGQGAGTIPLWFKDKLPNTEVDSIDLDPDVIAAAPCFGVENSKTIKLIEEDGRKYIEDQQDGSIDIIFMDAFDDQDYIPQCLQTVEFFQTMRRKLSPKGVVSMNVWRREIGRIYSSFQQAFGPQNLEIGTSPGLGNLVVLAHSNQAVEGSHQDADVPVAADAEEIAIQWSGAADFQRGGPMSLLQRAGGDADDMAPQPALFDADGCPSAAARAQAPAQDLGGGWP